MGRIERLILQHSGRGMDVLQPLLSERFCTDAADAILRWERGTVLLTTGFYVAGHAETDGPPGTACLAYALQKAGFSVVVLTDPYCSGYFEEFGIAVRYLPTEISDEALKKLVLEYAPVGMISVERCGKNIRGEYANMRGVSISSYTAPVDRVFDMGICPTVAIGDGGNEIGMGNLADTIEEKLSLVPCKVCTDHLVIATVSNWGALGLSAGLGWLPSETEYRGFYETAQKLGFVDGITKRCELGEDGFPLEIGLELLQSLRTE